MSFTFAYSLSSPVSRPSRTRMGLWLAMVLVTLGLGGCGSSPTAEAGTVVQPEDGPRACGSRGLAACAEGEFCLFDVAAECGAADQPGECTVIPQICTREFRAVCGCDGRTYSNTCDAHAGGASVARDGSCAAQPDEAEEPASL